MHKFQSVVAARILLGSSLVNPSHLDDDTVREVFVALTEVRT